LLTFIFFFCSIFGTIGSIEFDGIHFQTFRSEGFSFLFLYLGKIWFYCVITLPIEAKNQMTLFIVLMWLFYLSILFLHNFFCKFLFQFQENGNVFFCSLHCCFFYFCILCLFLSFHLSKFVYFFCLLSSYQFSIYST